MTTSTSTHSDHAVADAPSRPWAGRRPPSRVTGSGRRRRVPHLLLGVLLVAGCVVGAIVVGSQLGNRISVLALARAVTVGQSLTTKDIRQVAISFDSGLDVVHAESLSSVVGRPVAFSLPAGALLTGAVLGDPLLPPSGYALAAVALKPGQFPLGLAPGTRVAVLVAPAAGSAGGSAPPPQASPWIATVTGVEQRGNDQTTVAVLLLAEGDAHQLATAPAGQISLVAVNGGGR